MGKVYRWIFRTQLLQVFDKKKNWWSRTNLMTSIVITGALYRLDSNQNSDYSAILINQKTKFSNKTLSILKLSMFDIHRTELRNWYVNFYLNIISNYSPIGRVKYKSKKWQCGQKLGLNLPCVIHRAIYINRGITERKISF